MTEAEEQAIENRVRGMQIIASALIAGVLIFFGIATYLALNHVDPPGPAPLPMLTIVAFIMLGGCGGISFLVLWYFRQNAARQIATGIWQPPQGIDPKDYESDIVKLLGAEQAVFIMGLALLDAPAFMGCIAFLVEAKWYAVAVIVIAVSLMILRFPTHDSLREWLYEQKKQIDELRAGGAGVP